MTSIIKSRIVLALALVCALSFVSAPSSALAADWDSGFDFGFNEIGSWDSYTGGGWDSYTGGGWDSYSGYDWDTGLGSSWDFYTGSTWDPYTDSSWDAYTGNSWDAYTGTAWEPYTYNEWDSYVGSSWDPYVDNGVLVSAPDYGVLVSAPDYGVLVSAPEGYDTYSYDTYSYDTYSYTPYTVSTPSYSYSTPYTKVSTAPISPVTSYPPQRPVQQYIPPTSQPAPYCTIQATPATISSGQSSSLIWTSSNALSASLTGFGSVPTSGSRTVSPTSFTTYMLTVFGTNGQTVNCQTTVGVTGGPVIPPPPIYNAPYCTISITSAYNYGSLYGYGYNQAATLSWSSQNATSATISGLGSVSLSGSQTVYPSYNQTYTMTVYGPGGSANCQTNYYQQITPPVYSPVYPPVYPSNLYCTLTASPANIQNGQSALLSWTSTGASSAWLSDGLGNVYPNGSLAVRPESTRYYTLTVSNGYQTQTCRATVNVSGSYINLTQIPYTGFDLGPIGNALYWTLLVGLAVGAGYFLVYQFPSQMSKRVFAVAGIRRAKKIPAGAAVKTEEIKTSIVSEEKKFSGDTMVLAQSKDGSMPRIVISRN